MNKIVSYQDYIKEKETLGVLLEKKTLVKDITTKIWFINLGNDSKIEIGLNVAGTGDISALVATRFAYCIEVAAELAKDFKYNGYMIAGTAPLAHKCLD